MREKGEECEQYRKNGGEQQKTNMDLLKQTGLWEQKDSLVFQMHEKDKQTDMM